MSIHNKPLVCQVTDIKNRKQDYTITLKSCGSIMRHQDKLFQNTLKKLNKSTRENMQEIREWQKENKFDRNTGEECIAILPHLCAICSKIILPFQLMRKEFHFPSPGGGFLGYFCRTHSYCNGNCKHIER